MKRGDLVLADDNYLGIIIEEATVDKSSQWKVFCGNGLTTIYQEQQLQLVHFKSTGLLLLSNNDHPVANFAEILKG